MTTTKDFLAACEVIDGLRAQLAAVTRERDEERAEIARLRGDTTATHPGDCLESCCVYATAIVAIRARDRLRAVLEETQAKYEALNAEAERAYGLVMDYEGAVQAVSLDELMRSRLERLKEAEEHHREHRAALEETPENVDAIVSSWRQGMMDTQHEIVREVLAALRARLGIK